MCKQDGVVCGTERTLQCWQAVIGSFVGRQGCSLLPIDLQNSCKGRCGFGSAWTRDPAPLMLRMTTHAQEQF